MSFDGSNETGGASVETGAQGAEGGGAGTITSITSTDLSLTVTNPTGPIVDLAVTNPGQDPNNVAITGGSIAGVTINGVASSEIAGNTAGLALFYQRSIDAANYLLTKVPSIPSTRYRRIDPGISYTGQNTNNAALLDPFADANVDGGGATPSSGFYLGFGGTVIQNPKTTPFALWFRGKLVGASGSYLGFQSPVVGGGYINMAHDTSVNTKWQLTWSDGVATTVSSTPVADDLEHDFYLYSDGITLAAEVDKVLMASTAVFTHIPTARQVIALFNTTNGGAVVKEIIFGI